MIEFNINREDLRRIFEKLDRVSPKSKARALVTAFRKASLMVKIDLQNNVSGKILKRRTGHLAQSITSRVDITEEGLTGVIGSGVRTGNRVEYANIHETGGVITARRVRYLTIPTKYALTGAKDVKRISARDFENTFVRQGIIWQRKGKRKIIPLFVLKKSVTIPKRKYMSKTLEEDKEKIIKMLVETIVRELER